MALYVGDTPIKRVYHGDTPIKKIYYGDTLVWSAFDGVPTGLSSSRTRNTFTPSWNDVTDADGYDLRWSTNSDMTGATTVTGATSGTPVTGLNASTTYYWEVRAKQGSILAPWSATQSVTTAAALTAPSRGAAPTPTGGTQQMQWVATAPADGGSTITGYDWRWRRVGAAGWTTVSNGSATFTRTGLLYGTQYEAQFKAKNTIGTAADWSPSGTGTTTAASAPARGAAPSANGGNQQVAWTATAPSNGGSAITHYLWRWREVGAVSWRTTVTTTSRTFTRTGLTANTQYEAQYKARNAIGDAASWSPSGRATTDAVVQLPVADAPSATINAVASGNEGTTVRLTRTLDGGTYDQYLNQWTVDEGTLDDATADSPTWTRPAVSATKNVGVNYGITVRGSGTAARSGTTDSASAPEVQAEVVNIATLRYATAGTFTLLWPSDATSATVVAVGGSGGGGGGGGGGASTTAAGGREGGNGGAGTNGGHSIATHNSTTITGRGGGRGTGGRGGAQGGATAAGANGADGLPATGPVDGGTGGFGGTFPQNGGRGGDGGHGQAATPTTGTLTGLSRNDPITIVVGAAGRAGAGGRRGQASNTGATDAYGRPGGDGSDGSPGSVTITPA